METRFHVLTEDKARNAHEARIHLDSQARDIHDSRIYLDGLNHSLADANKLNKALIDELGRGKHLLNDKSMESNRLKNESAQRTKEAHDLHVTLTSQNHEIGVENI